MAGDNSEVPVPDHIPFSALKELKSMSSTTCTVAHGVKYGTGNGTSLSKRRKSHEIAGDLFKTLSQNSSLAALITKLQLGIEVTIRFLRSSERNCGST